MKVENDGPTIIDIDGTPVTAETVTEHRDGHRRTDFTMSTPDGCLGVVFRIDRGEHHHDDNSDAGHDTHIWYYRSSRGRNRPTVGPFTGLVPATRALLKAS